MIRKGKTKSGDFVTVTEAFHDYTAVGDCFKLIDVTIPGEDTSALGWKVDMKTGIVLCDPSMGHKAYKLPHDKVAPANRRALAETLRIGLRRLATVKREADVAYQVQLDRIEGLLNYESSEEEVDDVLKKVFNFI